MVVIMPVALVVQAAAGQVTSGTVWGRRGRVVTAAMAVPLAITTLAAVAVERPQLAVMAQAP